MTPGAKPKPHHLKLLQGTDRPDRTNENAPELIARPPVPADFLSRRGKKIFASLAAKLKEMGYASDAHSEALSLLADRLDEIQTHKATLRRGRTYKTKSTTGATIIKVHPAVPLLNEALRHAQSLLADFGLNPSSASRIDTRAVKDQAPTGKANPWNEI